MAFYLLQNGQKLGPYSIEQIRDFLRQGLVNREDQIWAEGWKSWLKLGQVPGLTNPENQSIQAYNPQNHRTESNANTSSGLIYAEGKEPVLAAVLSFFVVGTGQFYNGEWAKGWVLMVTCIVAASFSCGATWFIWALVSVIDAYRVAAKLKPLNSWNWWA